MATVYKRQKPWTSQHIFHFGKTVFAHQLVLQGQLLSRRYGQSDMTHFAGYRHPAALRQRRTNRAAQTRAGAENDFQVGLFLNGAADLDQVFSRNMRQRPGQGFKIIEQTKTLGLGSFTQGVGTESPVAIGERDQFAIHGRCHIHGSSGQFCNATLLQIVADGGFKPCEIVVLQNLNIAHCHGAKLDESKPRVGAADIAKQCKIGHDYIPRRSLPQEAQKGNPPQAVVDGLFWLR